MNQVVAVAVPILIKNAWVVVVPITVWMITVVNCVVAFAADDCDAVAVVGSISNYIVSVAAVEIAAAAVVFNVIVTFAAVNINAVSFDIPNAVITCAALDCGVEAAVVGVSDLVIAVPAVDIRVFATDIKDRNR